MRFVISAIALFLFCANSSAYFQSANDREAPREMNGIKFDELPDFVKDWQLITVRYRADSGEIRFVYGNAAAMAELQSLKPNYPDGAMFAKVALASEDDPSFPSSKMPSQSARVQIMLKDKKKYADTDGWGYALFDRGGAIFMDEDVAHKTQGCVACHRVVPERDYVFSRRANFDFKSLKSKKTEDALVENSKNAITFKSAEAAKVSAKFAPYLKKVKIVELVTGEIQKHKFSGTLDEIVPSLINQVKRTSTSAALFFDNDNFSLVALESKKKACPNPKAAAYHLWVISNARAVRDTTICQ